MGVKSVFVPHSNEIKKRFLQKTMRGAGMFVSAFPENKQSFTAFRVEIIEVDWTLRFDTITNLFLYPGMKKGSELQHWFLCESV